ncbi:uncharacterized protein CIMG_11321 [Coccidioides immitis RS]|uniref:Uncharacterized protein n=1 Tax=Coccidioides immitis (strain RS) TaxID=246410 RepID=A0A0D8JXI3_COCIM|nr:uncharacterized protein CIMG_11321 [Coccidioides immitis RS]KJF60983.1 hypothetical protein CIMG_11321 [Coccidioides immitis RS]
MAWAEPWELHRLGEFLRALQRRQAEDETWILGGPLPLAQSWHPETRVAGKPCSRPTSNPGGTRYRRSLRAGRAYRGREVNIATIARRLGSPDFCVMLEVTRKMNGQMLRPSLLVFPPRRQRQGHYQLPSKRTVIWPFAAERSASSEDAPRHGGRLVCNQAVARSLRQDSTKPWDPSTSDDAFKFSGSPKQPEPKVIGFVMSGPIFSFEIACPSITRLTMPFLSASAIILFFYELALVTYLLPAHYVGKPLNIKFITAA